MFMEFSEIKSTVAESHAIGAGTVVYHNADRTKKVSINWEAVGIRIDACDDAIGNCCVFITPDETGRYSTVQEPRAVCYVMGLLKECTILEDAPMSRVPVAMHAIRVAAASAAAWCMARHNNEVRGIALQVSDVLGVRK